MLFTRDGHNIFLGDLYRGHAAFLVCSGPSLATHDLSRLQGRGILSLSVNNAATTVRTQLWCCVDDPGNFSEAIWQDPGITKFVPLCHMEKTFMVRNEEQRLVPSTDRVGDMPAVFGYRRNESFVAEQWLYEDTFNWGNHGQKHDALGIKGSRSVMYVALRMLFYLGVRRVYLLGCDFKMEVGKQNYAFAQERSKSSVNGNNHSYQVLNSRLEALKPYFDREGFEVFNCTPNSGLTVFPYVDYDEAIGTATVRIPTEIITAGMYDRQAREREAAKAPKPTAKKAKSPKPVLAKKSPIINGTKKFSKTDLAGLPDCTLFTVVDETTAPALAHSWPTWMEHRAELREMPVVVAHEPGLNISNSLLSFLLLEPRVQLVPWPGGTEGSKILRAAQASIQVPVEHIQTRWYLKIDPETLALPNDRWWEPHWFHVNQEQRESVLIGTPYYLPMSPENLQSWNTWADAQPELPFPSKAPAYALRDPKMAAIRSPWSSYFFAKTDWVRELAPLIDADSPKWDGDLFLFFCAARRNEEVLFTSTLQYGWEQYPSNPEQLRRAAQHALRNGA